MSAAPYELVATIGASILFLATVGLGVGIAIALSMRRRRLLAGHRRAPLPLVTIIRACAVTVVLFGFWLALTGNPGGLAILIGSAAAVMLVISYRAPQTQRPH